MVISLVKLSLLLYTFTVCKIQNLQYSNYRVSPNAVAIEFSVNNIEKNAVLLYYRIMKNYFSYPTSDSCLVNGYELSMYERNNIGVVYSHAHDFYEIYFFVGGSAKYILEKSAYPLAKNTLIVVPPHREHSVEFLSGGEVYQRAVLWVRSSLFDALSSGNFAEPVILHLGDGTGTNVDYLLKLLFAEQERSEKDFTDYFGKESVFQEYIRLILSNVERAKSEIYDRSELSVLITNYILANLEKKITTDDIAARFGFSKYHLMRRFMKETGVPIHQYMLKARLQKAKELMAQNMTASQASCMCGFSEYTTFYKAFVRVYSISPGEYLAGFR